MIFNIIPLITYYTMYCISYLTPFSLPFHAKALATRQGSVSNTLVMLSLLNKYFITLFYDQRMVQIMIKKIGHIILALIILATTAGMTISEHYCGDTLREVSFMIEADPCCDIPDDCCHNESSIYVIDDSFSVSNFNFEFTSQVISVPVNFELFKVSFQEQSSILAWIDTPPPPKISTLLAEVQSFLL